MAADIRNSWHQRTSPGRERAVTTRRRSWRRGGSTRWTWASSGRRSWACASQIKRANSQSPSNGACCWNVLVNIPESLVVAWINPYRGVVAPTLAAGLGAGPVDDRSFAEGHLARRIAGVPGRVKHTWKNGWVSVIRRAKTKGNVAKRVEGNTSHPAVNPVGKSRCISALLEDNRAAVGIADFPPANTSHFSIWPGAGRDGLVRHQRLVTAEIAIS